MKRIKKLLKKNIIFYPLLILIILFAGVTIMPLPKKISQYESLKKQQKEDIALKNELETNLSIVSNEQIRLDIARAQYKISQEGEILFVFPTDNDQD